MTEEEKLIANQKYWSGRTQRAAHGLYTSQEEKTAAYLSTYTKAYNDIEKETAALYAKYSYEGKLPLSELYRYERNTKYIEQLKKICADLGASEGAIMKTSFESLYQSAMKDVMKGFGIDFGKISQKQMDQILNHPWSGADYSSRLWKNKDDLINKLSQTVTRGSIQGKSITEMTRELRDHIETSAYNARRLIRTESMHFINQGQLDGYRKSGVTQVEILTAADERRCPECGALDGQIVDIKEADTVLPVHAQCRCTYCPVIATMNTVRPANTQQLLQSAPVSNSMDTQAKTLYNDTKQAFKANRYSGIEDIFAREIDSRFLDLANSYPIESQGITVKAAKTKRELGHYINQLDMNSSGVIYSKNELVLSNLGHTTKDASEAAHKAEALYRNAKNSNVSALATVDHEYAHAIDAAIALKKDPALATRMAAWVGKTPTRPDIASINSVNAAVYGSKDKISLAVKEAMKKQYSLTDTAFTAKVRDELGSYAASSTGEFFAEGFSAYRNIPAAQQTEFLQAFGQTFEKLFWEVK